MESLHFSELLESINQHSSSKDKKALVQTAAGKNTFTSYQVSEMLDKFAFSKDQLQTLEVLRPRISDTGNTFQLMDVFTFAKDKKRASQLLGHPEVVESALNMLKHRELSQGVEMPAAMGQSDFSGLLVALDGQSFPKDKLYLIELAAFRNTFTSNQVVLLLEKLKFSRHKLKALSIIHYRITDPENNFHIISAFVRGLDKKRASELLK
ncbi:MAG: DUF4476 domain-containing protein [Pseudomonadota bacterium]